MLGNFSIGDYFKEEAIQYAHELLVNIYSFDINRLYITVYEKDETSYNK
jgi:alanyl-tRNA synthetase